MTNTGGLSSNSDLVIIDSWQESNSTSPNEKCSSAAKRISKTIRTENGASGKTDSLGKRSKDGDGKQVSHSSDSRRHKKARLSPNFTARLPSQVLFEKVQREMAMIVDPANDSNIPMKVPKVEPETINLHALFRFDMVSPDPIDDDSSDPADKHYFKPIQQVKSEPAAVVVKSESCDDSGSDEDEDYHRQRSIPREKHRSRESSVPRAGDVREPRRHRDSVDRTFHAKRRHSTSDERARHRDSPETDDRHSQRRPSPPRRYPYNRPPPRPYPPFLREVKYDQFGQKVCNFFFSRGFCKKGNTCRYSHRVGPTAAPPVVVVRSPQLNFSIYREESQSSRPSLQYPCMNNGGGFPQPPAVMGGFPRPPLLNQMAQQQHVVKPEGDMTGGHWRRVTPSSFLGPPSFEPAASPQAADFIKQEPIEEDRSVSGGWRKIASGFGEAEPLSGVPPVATDSVSPSVPFVRNRKSLLGDGPTLPDKPNLSFGQQASTDEGPSFAAIGQNSQAEAMGFVKVEPADSEGEKNDAALPVLPTSYLLSIVQGIRLSTGLGVPQQEQLKVTASNKLPPKKRRRSVLAPGEYRLVPVCVPRWKSSIPDSLVLRAESDSKLAADPRIKTRAASAESVEVGAQPSTSRAHEKPANLVYRPSLLKVLPAHPMQGVGRR